MKRVLTPLFLGLAASFLGTGPEPINKAA